LNILDQNLYIFFKKNDEEEEYEPASSMFVKMPLQSNLTNPYLYDDYRRYRESYKSGNHGMPNPNAKK
jgi:hypothetical protein